MKSTKSIRGNNEQPQKLNQKFSSVDEMMRSNDVSSDVQDEVNKLRKQSRVSRQLAEIRSRAGLTQAEMADRIGCSQSCISKWESESDDSLTLKVIKDYCAITDQRIGLLLGKPMSHVEAVKACALGLRDRLKALAALAKDGDDELEKGIQAFFGEAFFNLLDIFEKCHRELPSSRDFEIKVEVHEVQPSDHDISKPAENITAVND